MITIVSENAFRSEPTVNSDEDMVRVKLDMPKWKWREIKHYLMLQNATNVNFRIENIENDA
jgi:hypothetical protein